MSIITVIINVIVVCLLHLSALRSYVWNQHTIQTFKKLNYKPVSNIQFISMVPKKVIDKRVERHWVIISFHKDLQSP